MFIMGLFRGRLLTAISIIYSKLPFKQGLFGLLVNMIEFINVNRFILLEALRPLNFYIFIYRSIAVLKLSVY